MWQCVETGLVDGSKIFVDARLVDADVSNHSVMDTQSLRIHLRDNYKKLEARLEGFNGGTSWLLRVRPSLSVSHQYQRSLVSQRC